jgi:predicted MFS family arabinose efflux permease
MAATLAGAAAFVNLYAPQSLMPLLHGWIGQSAALAGAIVSAGTLGVALAAPWVGLLADRIGRQRVIVWAALLAAIPGFAVTLAQTPEQMILARFVQGLCLPGIFAVTVAYIGSEWPPSESRAVTALYVAGTILGGFSGRFTAGMVAEFAGWRWAFFALAIMQLTLALIIRAWLPPEQHKARPGKGSGLGQLLALFQRTHLRSAYAVGFSLLFALVAGFTYITLRLAEPPFSLGPAALSSIFAVYLIGGFITPLAGKLLNRMGHGRLLTLAWGIAIAGLACSLSAALWMVVLGLALFSAGLFIAQTTATSFVAEASGAARAPAVGLYVFSYYAGGSIGGVLPAPIWNLSGWAGVAILIAVVGMASVYIGRRYFRVPTRAEEWVESSSPGTPLGRESA